MKVIICGAGEVGRHLSEVLDAQGHAVTMIDLSSKKLRSLEEHVDIRSIMGSACHAKILEEAGVERCDLLVAATNQDEVNLLSGVVAKRMGAKKVKPHDGHSCNCPNPWFLCGPAQDTSPPTNLEKD